MTVKPRSTLPPISRVGRFHGAALSPGARNTFTINPLALQHSQLGVEYERAFGKGFSLYAAPEFAYGRTPEAWTLQLAGTLGIGAEGRVELEEGPVEVIDQLGIPHLGQVVGQLGDAVVVRQRP